MKLLKVFSWICSVLAIFMLSACGGGSSSNGTGTLSLGLTDASIDYQAVYVTIKEVQVHAGDETDEEDAQQNNWQVVATPEKTYNLLELVNGVIEQLGLTDLEAGHYTQLRMIIGENADEGKNVLEDPHPYANYIIDEDDIVYELKIPSGYKTGIKIVHGFDIADGQTTELVIDFDASKSIVKAGNSGKWLLKPTIKVIDTQVSATISGKVTDTNSGFDVIPTDLEGVPGVLVSAQTYDPDAEDIKDRVVVQTSTITNAEGLYSMSLDPGTYNILLYKSGYVIACTKIEVEDGISYGQDYILGTVEAGTINGVVTIDNPTVDQNAVLSFRQDFQCDNSTAKEPIEVKSVRVTSGTSYGVSLPPAIYNLVASTEGRTTQENNIDLSSGDVITQDISF